MTRNNHGQGRSKDSIPRSYMNGAYTHEEASSNSETVIRRKSGNANALQLTNINANVANDANDTSMVDGSVGGGCGGVGDTGGGGGGGGLGANNTSANSPSTSLMDFDDFLPLIGEFGRYQKCLFLCMIPFAFFVAFVYFSQIFLTILPDQHWCTVPELQDLPLAKQ